MTSHKSGGYAIVETFILRSDTIIGEQLIPLYDLDAVAGIASLFVDQHAAIDEVSVADIPKCDGAIHVKGDSMSPLLMPGDIALYKTVPNRRGGLFFGKIYLVAFDLDGEEYMVIKYVYQSETPGYYRLVSLNPRYRPREIPVDCVRALALIKTTMRLVDD